MSDNNRISELQKQIDILWSNADLGPAVKVETSALGDATPYVEVSDQFFDIVISERGNEMERHSRKTLAQTSRWYIHGMAAGHSQQVELKTLRKRVAEASNAENGGYSRWNWMALTIETMAKVSPYFGVWVRAHYREILNEYPLEEYEIRNALYPLLVD